MATITARGVFGQFASCVRLLVLAVLVTACGGGGESGASSSAPAGSRANAQYVTADYTNVIQYLYVSYCGRPADPGGLAFWAGYRASNGGNAPTDLASFTAAYYTIPAVETVMDNFGISPESIALYGTNNSTIVTATIRRTREATGTAPKRKARISAARRDWAV